MKLYIPGISEAICFGEQTVHTIVIENQDYLYKLLKDFETQFKRFEGKSILSIANTPIEMSKHAEMVTDFIRFDLNQKALIGKIISALDTIAQSESYYEKTQTLLSQIESHLFDISVSFDCRVDFEGVSMAQIIKASGITVTDDFRMLSEKVYTYMETVTEFLGEKLFVFLNLRSFLSDEEMQAFLDTVISHGFKMLLIEAVDKTRLKSESRITIDIDLCEF